MIRVPVRAAVEGVLNEARLFPAIMMGYLCTRTQAVRNRMRACEQYESLTRQKWSAHA